MGLLFPSRVLLPISSQDSRKNETMCHVSIYHKDFNELQEQVNNMWKTQIMNMT